MPYKTILVHVDSSRHADSRMRAAARLARVEQGHLIGAAMSGVSRYIYQDSGMDLARTVLASHMDALYQRANAALDRFDNIAAAEGVDSFERRLVDDEADGGLALQARYADLVVVSQSDPDDPAASIAPGLPEYVMLSSARPVLVLPHAGDFDIHSAFGDSAGKVLLAWDASLEATRAVSAALPLLRRAAMVTVAMFNPDSSHGPQAGHDMALYLARHGVRAEVSVQHTSIDVAESMLSLASDLDAHLMVMGGYGHTRFRELILGGVTTTILRSMTLPVLMAH